tara:strand:- start:116 stop:961 length:846 start_codon:yes stop_codon:yes gene_type:complete
LDFLNRCIVCGEGAQSRKYWEILRRCDDCSHVWADLDEGEFQDDEVYSEDYFLGGDYGNYLNDADVFKKHFQDRLRDCRNFLQSGHLLEVGCAYGLFLREASSCFDVCGYDIAPEPVKHARDVFKLDARCEEFANAQIEPESFDAVVLWDTIEHLPRPDLTLKKVSMVLRPGGYCFLTTGDIGSLLARFRKRRWRMIHPPTHLHYFNKQSILRILESVGFSEVQFKYVGVRRSFRQVAFGLFQLGREQPSKINNSMQKLPGINLSFILNTFDIMMVVAKKV